MTTDRPFFNLENAYIAINDKGHIYATSSFFDKRNDEIYKFRIRTDLTWTEISRCINAIVDDCLRLYNTKDETLTKRIESYLRKIDLEKAEEYFVKNKNELLEQMHNDFKSTINIEDHGIEVNFGDFALIYQSGDMNGQDKEIPHWNNEGANYGVKFLENILTNDQRYQRLIFDENDNYYVKELVQEFCAEIAEKKDIAQYYIFDEEFVSNWCC